MLCEKCKGEVSQYPEDQNMKPVGEPGHEWAIVCSGCGGADSVPFKPTEGWAVYCRSCHEKRRR